jgi:endo-1,4-beta-D-glucanase Y
MPINFTLWKQRYLKSVDASISYVASMDTHNTENVACVSEAIGFGLLITVLENDRESFNKLYKFYTK